MRIAQHIIDITELNRWEVIDMLPKVFIEFYFTVEDGTVYATFSNR